MDMLEPLAHKVDSLRNESQYQAWPCPTTEEKDGNADIDLDHLGTDPGQCVSTTGILYHRAGLSRASAKGIDVA